MNFSRPAVCIKLSVTECYYNLVEHEATEQKKNTEGASPVLALNQQSLLLLQFLIYLFILHFFSHAIAAKILKAAKT